MADSAIKEDAERDFVKTLIALYRDSPELWKVKSKDYFNQSKKQISLQKIVDELIQFKPDFTVEKLKKKINTLRTNFNRDFRAIENARRSGVSIEDIPKPKLWYFDDMIFIKDQLEIGTSEISEVGEDSQFLPQSQGQPLQPQEPIIKLEFPQKRSATNRYEETKKRKLMNISNPELQSSSSDSRILAMAWAVEFAKLRADQQLFAKKFIDDIIFEGRLGNLHRNSFIINDSTRPSSGPISEKDFDPFLQSLHRPPSPFSASTSQYTSSPGSP